MDMLFAMLWPLLLLFAVLFIINKVSSGRGRSGRGGSDSGGFFDGGDGGGDGGGGCGGGGE